MLLTLSTTHRPATDLGYLLHKNPARVQAFELSFGKAHVVYTRASEQACQAALVLDVDPVGLVRTSPGEKSLEQYVNDRPYVASSFLSVAIAQVFGSALAGRCRERPELVATPIPLEATVVSVPCRAGPELLTRLFAPLGYEVEVVRHPLDEKFPEWGEGPYYTLTLRATCTLSSLLTHLYVLIPVLDNDKHYFVGAAEVDKLLKRGEGWLASHPERDLIVERYLKHFSRLTRDALSRLTEDDTDPDAAAQAHDAEEEAAEQTLSLNEQRHGAVVAALKASGAHRVLDLGCAEGRLIRSLLKEKQFEEIVGVDVSLRSLERAEEVLKLDQLAPTQRARVKLLHGSLMYRDQRLAGYEAAAVVEVIEHLDGSRLAAFERVLFEFAAPKTIVVTTPNVEYNVKWETLPAGQFRHRDHRFEWTRGQFQGWAQGVAGRFGYSVRFLAVGPEDAEVGAPTQMGVFSHA